MKQHPDMTTCNKDTKQRKQCRQNMEEFSSGLESQRHEARATDSKVTYPLHNAQRTWQERDALIAKLLE